MCGVTLCVTTCVWMSEDNLESQLSYLVPLGNQIQDVRLGSKHLYLLSAYPWPFPFFFPTFLSLEAGSQMSQAKPRLVLNFYLLASTFSPVLGMIGVYRHSCWLWC